MGVGVMQGMDYVKQVYSNYVLVNNMDALPQEIKAALAVILDDLDHKNLNDIAYFNEVNPTSENIAKYIYDKLRAAGARPQGGETMVAFIRVWESDKACATPCTPSAARS